MHQSARRRKYCRKYKEDTEGKKAELERVRQVELDSFWCSICDLSKISVQIPDANIQSYFTSKDKADGLNLLRDKTKECEEVFSIP